MKIFLILFLLISFSFSQTVQNSETVGTFSYISTSFGRSFMPKNDKHGEEVFLTFGLSYSRQNWPNLFTLKWQANSEWTFPERNVSTGFVSNIYELKLLYSYMFLIPTKNSLFLSFGTGIGLSRIIQNGKTIGEDAHDSERKKFFRMSLPIEIHLGFLKSNRKIQPVNIVFVGSINSIASLWALKLQINF